MPTYQDFPRSCRHTWCVLSSGGDRDVGGSFVARAGVYCCVAENLSAEFMGHCWFVLFYLTVEGLCFCFCSLTGSV